MIKRGVIQDTKSRYKIKYEHVLHLKGRRASFASSDAKSGSCKTGDPIALQFPSLRINEHKPPGNIPVGGCSPAPILQKGENPSSPQVRDGKHRHREKNGPAGWHLSRWAPLLPLLPPLRKAGQTARISPLGPRAIRTPIGLVELRRGGRVKFGPRSISFAGGSTPKPTKHRIYSWAPDKGAAQTDSHRAASGVLGSPTLLATVTEIVPTGLRLGRLHKSILRG